MLLLKHLTKSSALRCPVLRLISPTKPTNPPRPLYYFYSTSAVAETRSGLNAGDVVRSFKEWFSYKPQNRVVLDQIFEVLSTLDDEDSASRLAADRALSQLGIRPTETFVLQVLDYGKTKDVVSCLEFFGWAGRQPGFYHTRATFYAIFKILKNAKLMPLTLEYLENSKKSRFYDTVRFNDILVMGYALAGKPEIALQLFGKMRFQGMDLDSYGYHVLLNALVEEGWFDAVAVICKQISMRGFESDVTQSIMLKNLCKQNKLEEAIEYFQKLVSGGVIVKGFMLGTLVDALCKNNRFEQAGEVLDHFSDCGVVVQLEKAYGVWLKNLVHAGRLDGALEFLKSKNLLEGYVPEVFRFNTLVSRLLKENRLMEVFDLFNEMRENQISPDRATINNALRFFCKAGMVDVAIELYKLRSEFDLSPNTVAYNYLINSLCGIGSIDEAYQVLENCIDQGLFPGSKTFSILADALCRDGKFVQMKNLVNFLLERKIMPRDHICDKFITALCKTERVELGYLIHWELRKINHVASESTYSQLIHGFKKSNKGDIAIRLLFEMQQKGYKPTEAVYRSVIHCLCNMNDPAKRFLLLLKMQLSCQEAGPQIFNLSIKGAGHAKRPDLARAVYEVMQRTGLEPPLSSNILMLQSYLKSNRISDALNFFNHLCLKGESRIPKKLYNVMIVGLCKAMKAKIALGFVREMKIEGLIPSMECYEEIVKLLCSTENYDMAVHIINDLEESGSPVSSFIGNTLLFHSLKTRDLYKAWIRSRGKLLNQTSKISLLGQLIGIFSGHIKVSLNVEDLSKMIAQCFPLDTYTYNMILRQLSTSEIDQACELYNRMRSKGYEPNQWTLDIFKRGLYKCLTADEAERMLEEISSSMS